MSPEEFKKLYMGEFVPSEEDIRLHELVKFYHEETEAYDKTVCEHVNDRGVAIPTTITEMRNISMYALRFKQVLIVENRDIDPEKIKQAIKNYRE